MASLPDVPASSSPANKADEISTKAEHQTLPDEATIVKASQASVFNHKGEKMVFGTLFENQKTVVVFIRHFFCGNCQAYVSELAGVKPEALEKAGVKLAVIGCGDWEPIDSYKENTSFPYEIYADPSRSLYHILNMTSSFTSTPSNQAPPKYLKGESVFKRISSSTLNFLMHPTLSFTGKSGDVRQNGGEFIFGPGNTCEFANRMRNTEDHVEVEDLMKAAGVDV